MRYEKTSCRNRWSGVVSEANRLLVSGERSSWRCSRCRGGGGSYEYDLKRQKDRVEQDFKAGKIDQKEYEIRKDQIARDSLLQ